MSATSLAQTSMINLVSPVHQSSYKNESNAVMDCLLSHSSDRSYKSDPIDESILEQILRAGQRAPTSCNSQDISVIVVKDREKIQRISELACQQHWIAECPVFFVLCGDYHKVELGMQMTGSGAPEDAHYLDGIMTVSTDAGIALQAMMLAARSFGLGCVPIGALRASVAKLCKLLKLPPYVVPIVGLCIGHVEQHAPLKPRMDLSTFAHQETYNADDDYLKKAINEYDQVMEKHWGTVSRLDGQKWSKSISGIFFRNPYPNLRAEVEQQKFVPN